MEPKAHTNGKNQPSFINIQYFFVRKLLLDSSWFIYFIVVFIGIFNWTVEKVSTFRFDELQYSKSLYEFRAFVGFFFEKLMLVHNEFLVIFFVQDMKWIKRQEICLYFAFKCQLQPINFSIISPSYIHTKCRRSTLKICKYMNHNNHRLIGFSHRVSPQSTFYNNLEYAFEQYYELLKFLCFKRLTFTLKCIAG